MWLKDKRGMINKSGGIVFIVIILISFFLVSNISSQLLKSGTKVNQYSSGNFTCEKFIDNVYWGAAGSKTAATATNFGWNRSYTGNSYNSYDCVGNKSCNMTSLYSLARYLNVGSDATLAVGGAYCNISDNASTVRFFAYQNETVAATLGPRVECGTGAATTSCVIANMGLNDNTYNYSVRCYAIGGGAGKQAGVADAFYVNYTWCWAPILHNANVSVESATYTTTFNFTVNVTNPTSNTTAYLWTRPVGGTWTQRGSAKVCRNCSAISPYSNFLYWEVAFSQADVGNTEFKFNSTDQFGYYMTAGNPSSTGTSTNECLDSGTDCVFAIQDVAVASGTPLLYNETVNAQTSATQGWGSNWTFKVNLSNPTDATSNINLTLLLDTGAGFTPIQKGTCSGPCQTNNTFTFYVDNLSCSDMNSSARYRFSAVNENGTTNATQTFNIEEDDISVLYTLGNNTIANRSGTQTDLLIIQLNDTDNMTLVGADANVTFYVKYNTVTFDSGTTNTTNSTGYVIYYFDPTCTPSKYIVGNRDWQANASGNSCYKNNASDIFNLSVRGDITLVLDEPVAGTNITQESNISFIGSVWDDCVTDSLGTGNVTYYANTTGEGVVCKIMNVIGANAFQCRYTTTIGSTEGWYNTTMIGNASYHYTNSTEKTVGDGGLFYLLPLYRLANPKGNSSVTGATSDGWGSPNWNFSVNASSGDANNVINVSLYMAKSVNPSTTCETTGNCENQTYTNCTTCNGYTMY